MKCIKFGVKCNNILVDELSLIDQLSFKAFNEGARLMHCLKIHLKLFGVYAKEVGVDTGYAGNANRECCREGRAHASFVKLGRPS